MRKRMRRPILFHYRECDSMAKYLEEQARKGWQFKEFRLGMVFERGEPKECRYRVEIFPRGSEQDLKPTRQTEEYADYCEAAGWKLVDSVGKICVFEQLLKDAEPIVTDAERLDNIWKAEKSRYLWGESLPLVWIFYWVLEISLAPTAEYLFVNQALLMFGITLLALCVYLWKVLGAVCWRMRQKKRINAGEKVIFLAKTHARGLRWGFNLVYLSAVPVILWFCADYLSVYLFWGVLIFLALLGCVSLLIGYFRPADSTSVHLVTTMVFIVFFSVGSVAGIATDYYEEKNWAEEAEKLPLTQNDFREPAEAFTFVDGVSHEGILGNYIYGKLDCEHSSLSYRIYASPYQWVLDQAEKKERKHSYTSRTEGEEWSAKQVWIQEEEDRNYYLIRYDDVFLMLYIDGGPLNLKQIEKICQVLQLGESGVAQ